MKVVKWFGLALVALFGLVVALVLGVPFHLYLAIGGRVNGKFWENVSIVLDKAANVLMGRLLNYTMIVKSSAHKFGSHRQTISKAIGLNKKHGTLTKFGNWWAKLLNKIDENHVEKASDVND